MASQDAVAAQSASTISKLADSANSIVSNKTLTFDQKVAGLQLVINQAQNINPVSNPMNGYQLLLNMQAQQGGAQPENTSGAVYGGPSFSGNLVEYNVPAYVGSSESDSKSSSGDYTGVKFIDDKINDAISNPAKTLINTGVSFLPGSGTVSDFINDLANDQDSFLSGSQNTDQSAERYQGLVDDENTDGGSNISITDADRNTLAAKMRSEAYNLGMQYARSGTLGDLRYSDPDTWNRILLTLEAVPGAFDELIAVQDSALRDMSRGEESNVGQDTSQQNDDVSGKEDSSG